MEYEFERNYFHDLENYSNDSEFFRLLAGKIKEIEKAVSLEDIPGLEEIRGRRVFFRFKIKTRKNTYRIGVKILHHVVWLVLIDNAKKRFYKRF